MRALLISFLVATPAAAATTMLDFSGPICGPAGDEVCANFRQIGPSYGSIAEVAVRWASRADPGNSFQWADYVEYWTTDYADLVGVAYSAGSLNVGEARFTVAPGQLLTLVSVDVGGWPRQDRISGVRVYDLDWNLLFDTGAIVFPGDTARTIALGQSSAAGLIFQWGQDAFNGGIDNLTFSVRATGGVIPEPATWAMLVAGFGLVGAALRRGQLAAPRAG